MPPNHSRRGHTEREREREREWRLSSAPLKTVENGNSHGKPNLTIPTLKLLIFNPNTKYEAEVSLWVPIPRVWVDAESLVQFRALNDHVEVKLVLLLPVDHPILASFDSDFSEPKSRLENAYTDDSRPLLMDSDIKSLSATGEVKFYCRSCSTQLTRALR